MQKQDSRDSVDRIVLLPCPFCGDDVELNQHAYTKKYSVGCDCFVESQTRQHDTAENATMAWNKRRVTGLVNWLVSEMQKYGESSYLEGRYQGLRDCRKMVKRFLGQ